MYPRASAEKFPRERGQWKKTEKIGKNAKNSIIKPLPGEAMKKRSKNSIIKPLSTISVYHVRKSRGGAPCPLLPMPMYISCVTYRIKMLCRISYGI